MCTRPTGLQKKHKAIGNQNHGNASLNDEDCS